MNYDDADQVENAELSAFANFIADLDLYDLNDTDLDELYLD